MFKRIFNKNNYYNTNTVEHDYNKLQESLCHLNKRANELQANFDFYIPDYIIQEIIENEDSKNFVNLHYLINCAVLNEKLSENNANLLKKIYSFKY